jgi:cytochrome c-type biogenesis protein
LSGTCHDLACPSYPAGHFAQQLLNFFDQGTYRMIAIILAFAAGVLTAAAPCILPMLPILLGASIGQQRGVRPLFIVAGFILAFSAFALLFGTFSTVLGISPETVRDISVVLLVGFGLLLIFQKRYELLLTRLNGFFSTAHEVGRRVRLGNLGGLFIGLALGAVWTPCAGPVLGTIVTLIATSRNLTQSGVLLVFYAMGAGGPMLAIAYGGQYVTTRVRRVTRYTPALQRGFGVAVLLTAAAIYTQYDTVFAVWLSNCYPNLQIGL